MSVKNLSIIMFVPNIWGTSYRHFWVFLKNEKHNFCYNTFVKSLWKNIKFKVCTKHLRDIEHKILEFFLKWIFLFFNHIWKIYVRIFFRCHVFTKHLADICRVNKQITMIKVIKCLSTLPFISLSLLLSPLSLSVSLYI